MANPSTFPKVPEDGSVQIITVESTHTVDFENGDTAANQKINDRIVVYDRNDIVAVRKGRANVPNVTMTVHLLQFTNGSNDVLLDALEFTGNFSGDTNQPEIPSDFAIVDLLFTLEGTAQDGVDHTVRYNNCVGLWNWSEAEPDTINLTFECYGSVVRTGQA
ncbi:hypothetical protein LCGC14_1415870 [marine sediment metagenome]|uniref:Uncharacterized protein n=1 Tax=marine sediment metagenome TaxID=412755 RepID=A0A0F9M8D2_9ZZZZ